MVDKKLLDEIKSLLGIDYSDENNDTNISTKIRAAQLYLKNGGVNLNENSKNNELYKLAIAIFVNDNLNVEPSKTISSPFFINFITQLKMSDEYET